MKTAIITGASSGIGAAIAKVFSEKDWKTILIARNEDRLQKVASQLNNSEILVADLSNSETFKTLADQLAGKNVTALVNNAGIYRPLSVSEDFDTPWIEHFNTNLMSAVRLTRLLWPQFKTNKKGSIVNISSTLAIRPIANTAAYSALKAAMNNWTQSLAIEGAPYNIRANCVCPGIVDTPIHAFHQSQEKDHIQFKKSAQKMQPLGRIGRPEDIAPTVYHFCDTNSAWTTGTIFNVDGGILLNS